MYNKYIQEYLNIILQSRKDNYYQQLLRAKNNYNQLLYTQEQAKELSETLFSYNNPKKEKMTLWFLIKGTVRLPQDQYKIDQAFNLVEKQHLNFQEYTTPQEIINRTDKSTLRINAQDQNFNPDTQPTFSNKQILKNGIAIYNVQDSKYGQKAVRKVIDVNWGYDANPWCLAARKQGFIRANRQQIQNMSQRQKQKLGLYNNNCLSIAWNFWSKKYTEYPKRIAFQNGKLLAFCANDKKEIKWWDRNDKSSSNIQGLQNEDDPEWFNLQYNSYMLAKNPNTPSEVLQKLANNKNQDVRWRVAEHQNTPQEILSQLANDKDDRVRSYIAENPNTSIETLNKLANDKDSFVKQCVAENPNTLPEILQKLANDDNQFVRMGVAKNPNIPLEILQKLANDDDQLVRAVAAENPNIPLEILIQLAKDKDSYVRQKVAKNLNTPPKILQKLADDENYIVRIAIAKNPNTSLKTLNKLANDINYEVKKEVAKNKNASPQILNKLANDENYYVSSIASRKINNN